jgi:hypothetical protein
VHQVDHDDLREALRELREEISEDFNKGQAETNRRLDEVNQHLRTLNGRVTTGEIARAGDDVRMKNLEREVFNRRRSDRERPPSSTTLAPQRLKGVVTDRDVRIVWLTLAAVVGVIEGLYRFGPPVFRFFRGLP